MVDTFAHNSVHETDMVCLCFKMLFVKNVRFIYIKMYENL